MLRKFSKIPLNGNQYHTNRKVNLVVRVFLIPASHGTGVIAGGAVRSVLSVGIHDVLSKSQDHQISQRCQSNFDALLQMRSAYSVAKQRGVSLEKF
jgi:small subunit ribosomal protein S5